MKFKNSYLRFLVLTAACVLIGILIYNFFPTFLSLAKYIINLFLPFIIGYIYVSLVRPFAKFLKKRLKLPDGISAIIVMVLSIGVVGGVLFLIIMRIVNEMRNLYEHFPAIYESAIDI